MMTGAAVESVVVRNLDAACVDVIDTGKSRTPSDVLHFHGHGNASVLAAACRMIIGFKESNGNMYKWAMSGAKQKRFTPQEVLSEATDKLTQQAVHAILPLKVVRKFMGGGVAALCYRQLLVAAQQDIYLVGQFFHGLEKGEHLEAGNPILTLRNALTVRDTSAYYSKGGSIMAAYRTALVFKAWNAWRAKKTIERLVWSSEREDFPTPQ